MRHRFYYWIVLVIIVFFGAYRFWKLGEMRTEPPERLLLQVQHAPVRVRKATTMNWIEVAAMEELHEQDAIETGEDGRATIQAFDQAEIRLDGNTQITIEHGSLVPGLFHSSVVELFLGFGRAWTRAIRLFDLQGSMVTKTPQVVATVRGTAYDLASSATSTRIWVSDSVVELSQGTKSQMVADEQKTQTDLRAPLVDRSVALMDVNDFASPWTKENRSQDEQFLSARKNARETFYLGSVRADGIWDRVQTLSERLHLSWISKNYSDRSAFYFGRHLIEVKRLIEQGKSGLGYQRLATELQSTERIQDLATQRAYGQTVQSVLVVLDDVGPSSPLYRMKQRLEDANVTFAGNDLGAALYARLLGVDARLDEAKRLMDAHAFDEAAGAIEAGAQGVQGGERDLEQLRSSNTEKDSTTMGVLQKKIQALHARMEVLGQRLSDLRTASELSVATSTTPLPITTTSTENGSAATSTSAVYTLKAFPNPLYVGGTSNLSLIVKQGAVQTDVTPDAIFRAQINHGRIDHASFLATSSGTVTIEAYLSSSTMPIATTTLLIKDLVKFSRIEIVPSGSTTLAPGDRVGVSVKAIYTNGQTKLVSPALIQWGSSNPELGNVTDGYFVAWIQGQGVVTVTATYQEDHLIRSATQPFTIQTPTSTRTP